MSKLDKFSLKAAKKAIKQSKKKVVKRREFAIGACKPEDLGDGSWNEVVGERKLYTAIHCEFGFAEEVIGFLEFEGETPGEATFEVGIGESLRPYDLRYAGNDRAAASKAFIEAIDHCSTL